MMIVFRKQAIFYSAAVVNQIAKKKIYMFIWFVFQYVSSVKWKTHRDGLSCCHFFWYLLEEHWITEALVSVDKTVCHMDVVSSEYSPLKSTRFVPWAVVISVFKVIANNKTLVSE